MPLYHSRPCLHKFRRHQSQQHFPCKIQQEQVKSVPLDSAVLFSISRRSHSKRRLSSRSLKDNRKSHPLSPLVGENECSPPSVLCPSYPSSASTPDQPSPWQTSPPLWLLCLLSAATQAPCFGLAGPVANKSKAAFTFNRRKIHYWAFCSVCFVQIPWQFSSCHECAFCPRLSLGLGQDCPGKPADLLAKRPAREEHKLK